MSNVSAELGDRVKDTNSCRGRLGPDARLRSCLAVNIHTGGHKFYRLPVNYKLILSLRPIELFSPFHAWLCKAH